MVFGPTVEFICGQCGAQYEAKGSCRCADKIVNPPKVNASLKSFEFEYERARIDRDEALRNLKELEELYAAKEEEIKLFEVALLRVKNMTVEELLKSFNGLSDKPSEEGMNFSLLEIE
jgi:hypothetical protein